MATTYLSKRDQAAFDNWGFTNDEAELARVRAFVAAAVADGWQIEPTYGQSESQETAARLHRDGYVMMALMRTKEPSQSTYRYEAHVSAWGPDGLVIRVKYPYDFASIQAQVRHCNLCSADDVETYRYSFAGRCCQSCIAGARATYEKPGWNQ